MKFILSPFRGSLLLLCMFVTSFTLSAQVVKPKPTFPELTAEITKMDSLLFSAYNNRDLEKMKPFFSPALELYQDNDGVKGFDQVMQGFKSLLSRDYVLHRELVKGSMEVYPIKGFGAIQTGSHQFCHVENGQLECATFKFLNIWEKTAAGWQIKRLVTYDH